jgi:peptidoglycan/LPS O-acetylase OafA/YrhL
MSESLNPSELTDRLELIQTMIAAGRRKTESWGWTFLLWGVAYYVAIGWSALAPAALYGPTLAWPVTMIVAGILTGMVARRMTKDRAETTLGRAIGSIWRGIGICLFVVLFTMSLSHRFEEHALVVVACSLLSAANASSGILLRWRAQFACAVVWWATAIVACFGNDTQVSIAFLIAIFLCQIAFGIYAMLRDSKARQQLEARHG